MEEKAQEEYMRAFLYLEKKRGKLSQSELASYLGISKAGVSGMMQILSKKGFVRKSAYKAPSLTEKGKTLAKKITFKHRVIEHFLASKLKMPATKVHAEACRLEHALSDDAARRLYKFLGKPKKDPHGSPISP